MQQHTLTHTPIRRTHLRTDRHSSDQSVPHATTHTHTHTLMQHHTLTHTHPSDGHATGLPVGRPRKQTARACQLTAEHHAPHSSGGDYALVGLENKPPEPVNSLLNTMHRTRVGATMRLFALSGSYSQTTTLTTIASSLCLGPILKPQCPNVSRERTTHTGCQFEYTHTHTHRHRPMHPG